MKERLKERLLKPVNAFQKEMYKKGFYRCKGNEGVYFHIEFKNRIPFIALKKLLEQYEKTGKIGENYIFHLLKNEQRINKK